MSKVDKVIQYFRGLREDAAMGPTMNTGSVIGGTAGFSSDAKAEGPVAGYSGYSGSLGFRRRKNGKLDEQSVTKRYQKWLKCMGML